MTKEEVIAILAIALIVLQIVYRLVDKKNNKDIITAISTGVKTFDNHIEKALATNNLVEDLYHMHDIKDVDGRYLWYLPKEYLETQRHLVETNKIIALTQKQIVKLLDRMDTKIESHSNICKDQYNILKDKVS